MHYSYTTEPEAQQKIDVHLTKLLKEELCRYYVFLPVTRDLTIHLVNSKVDGLNHFAVATGQRVVVAANLLLAKLLDLICHINYTAGETQRDE